MTAPAPRWSQHRRYGKREQLAGLRVCDDHDTAYKNGLTKDEIVGKSPAEISDLARGIAERSRDMIAIAKDVLGGVHTDDEFYAWADSSRALLR